MGPSVHEIGVCGRRIRPQLPISCGRVFLRLVRKRKCPGQWFLERWGEKTPASIVPDFVHKGAISGTRRSQFVHSPQKRTLLRWMRAAPGAEPRRNSAAQGVGPCWEWNRAGGRVALGRSCCAWPMLRLNRAVLGAKPRWGQRRAESSAALGRSRFAADGGLERMRRAVLKLPLGWGRATEGWAFAYTGSHTRTRQQWMCSPPRGVWSMLA